LGRAAGAAAGLAGTALAAAACGGAPPSVVLPAQTSEPVAAPALLTGPPRTPKAVVAAAYQGYWQAYASAMAAASPARARAILAPYAPASSLSQLVTSLRAVWAAHDSTYGGAVTHVRSVRITGRRAILNDCLDLSHFGVVNRRTGRVVPDSFGLANQDYYITLVRSAGRWRVSNMTRVEVPCES